MNAMTDLERSIAGWLTEESPGRAPDRVLATVRDRVARTGQRQFGFSWREPVMRNSRLALVLATALAAALAVVIVGALLLAGRQNQPLQPTPPQTVLPSNQLGPSASPGAVGSPLPSLPPLQLGNAFAVDLTKLGVAGLTCGKSGGDLAPSGALDVGPDGNAYVLSDKPDVLVIAPDGSLVRRWGRTGTKPGEFQAGLTHDLDVAPDGTVYVAESNGVTPSGGNVSGVFRILAYSAKGTFLRAWGRKGLGDPDFQNPAEIAAGPDGSVYVLDDLLDVVKRYRPDGAYVATVTRPGLDPGGTKGLTMLRVSPNGTLYVVAANGGARIQAWAADGSYLGYVSSYGLGPGQFNVPYDVGFGPDGSVYILDSTRIQAFDTAGTAIGSFELPSQEYRRIAIDGSTFWFCGGGEGTPSFIGHYDLP